MTLLQAILFFLPAGVGNMTPILSNKVPFLNNWKTPLDFGKSLRGKRIFGTNKTWRGLATGTLLAGLTAVLLNVLYPPVILNFSIGCLLGCGALVGDAVESFFKRQLNKTPGSTWFPFDQTDYIIGGLAFALPLARFTLPSALVIFIVYFTLHLVFSYIGYLLGLKEKPI